MASQSVGAEIAFWKVQLLSCLERHIYSQTNNLTCIFIVDWVQKRRDNNEVHFTDILNVDKQLSEQNMS